MVLTIAVVTSGILSLIVNSDRLQVDPSKAMAKGQGLSTTADADPLERWGALVNARATAGSAGQKTPRSPTSRAENCQHPYPCGGEWPADLSGPFEVMAGYPKEVQVRSFDGTRLHGWIWRPALPEGVKAPIVVFSSSPYYGQGTAIDPAGFPYETGEKLGATTRRFINAGFAVAKFSTRGTGNSEGCFELYGRNEQRDQKELVEWLGSQDWGNGRVGFWGYSYDSVAALSAAIQNPSSLKAVSVGAIHSDLYTWAATPQGAVNVWSPPYWTAFRATTSQIPPLGALKTQNVMHLASHASVAPTRFCPGMERYYTATWSELMGDTRDGSFFDERRLIDGFPNVTAAVMLVDGLKDIAGHAYQADEAWRSMTQAPKWFIFGPWDHFSMDSSGRVIWPTYDYATRIMTWFDYWLKGLGTAAVKKVDYADQNLSWSTDSSWPPSQSREEALYLTDGALSPVARPSSSSFLSAPSPTNRGVTGLKDAAVIPTQNLPGSLYNLWNNFGSRSSNYFPLCDGENGYGLVFTSQPVAAETLLAGNPRAFLMMSSSHRGGQIAAHLYLIGPDFACGAEGPSGGYRFLSGAAADLRFHRGNFEPRDFRIDQPEPVRLDFFNVAQSMPAGWRVALSLSYGDPVQGVSRYLPSLTIQGPSRKSSGSHVLIPVVRGTVGGVRPPGPYPSRPFIPIDE